MKISKKGSTDGTGRGRSAPHIAQVRRDPGAPAGAHPISREKNDRLPHACVCTRRKQKIIAASEQNQTAAGQRGLGSGAQGGRGGRGTGAWPQRWQRRRWQDSLGSGCSKRSSQTFPLGRITAGSSASAQWGGGGVRKRTLGALRARSAALRSARRREEVPPAPATWNERCAIPNDSTGASATSSGERTSTRVHGRTLSFTCARD